MPASKVSRRSIRGAQPSLLLFLLIALLGAAALFGLPRQAASNAVVPQVDETLTIGYSVQGQPIDVYRIGSGSHALVLVGAIHGSEVNSQVLVNDLLTHVLNNRHLLPTDTSVYILPALNPDGVINGSRYNANGVDLNRNWATDNWQTDTYDASGRVAGGGGPFPMSEPETAAMAGWLEYMRDSTRRLEVIFYHSAYPPSGLVLGGSLGKPYTPAYADVVGYGSPAPSRPGWTAYPVTGVAPHWCGDNNIGCFEVELPSRANLTPAQTQRHATAIQSVMLRHQFAPGQRCFVETGWCVAGRFRQYWEQHGGAAVFGLPISSEEEQVIDGVPRKVQWFERNRLEIHPEKPAPFDVQIGRIGVERLEQQGRNWWTFAPGDPAAAQNPACQYFPETRHAICGDVLATWRSGGLELDGTPGSSDAESLARFGMPLSEPQVEQLPDGSEYTVQWFERARFEIHSQPGQPEAVLLGLLGTEIQRAATGAAQ